MPEESSPLNCPFCGVKGVSMKPFGTRCPNNKCLMPMLDKSILDFLPRFRQSDIDAAELRGAEWMRTFLEKISRVEGLSSMTEKIKECSVSAVVDAAYERGRKEGGK